jgi:hypothetical protein
MAGTLVNAISQIGSLPGILQWRRARFNKAFVTGKAIGCCRGVFDTRDQAEAEAPRTGPLGYDHVEAAEMYRDRLERVYPSDYAMMLWLQKAFNEGARKVLDLGGHIGIAYYAYQRLIPFPPDVSWRVHDVPAVMESGRPTFSSRRVACSIWTIHSRSASLCSNNGRAGCLSTCCLCMRGSTTGPSKASGRPFVHITSNALSPFLQILKRSVTSLKTVGKTSRKNAGSLLTPSTRWTDTTAPRCDSGS